MGDYAIQCSAEMGRWPEVSREAQDGPLQPATRMHGWAGVMLASRAVGPNVLGWPEKSRSQLYRGVNGGLRVVVRGVNVDVNFFIAFLKRSL